MPAREDCPRHQGDIGAADPRTARCGGPDVDRRPRKRRIREPQGRATERASARALAADHVNEVNDLVLLLIGLAETHDGLLSTERCFSRRPSFTMSTKRSSSARCRRARSSMSPGYSVRDHGPAGAALAESYGVPAGVCELIRHHAPFNYDGHLPATAEGTILHYADLAAFDLAAINIGAQPIHAISVMLKKKHPILILLSHKAAGYCGSVTSTVRIRCL